MARQQQATHEMARQSRLRGLALLDTPTLNKGTAFTPEERREYGLEGLLPHAVETLDRQLERVLHHLDVKPTDLERYIYLIGLADRNETLFYRTLMSDPARFVPIVYDPTVADACLAFGHIYRRAHPRSRRHRRQRHGHPDRKIAALYGMRRGAARQFAANSVRHRHGQCRAPRRSALSRRAGAAALR